MSAVCTVNKGDLPIEIWWTFVSEFDQHSNHVAEAVLLSSNDGIMEQRTNNRISMLSVELVKARHRGNYSCLAKNRGGLVQYTAQLTVNGDSFDKLKFLNTFLWDLCSHLLCNLFEFL